ncbi:MAG: MATE family efflux transporter [Simkaniaceae bacterium]
MKQITEAYSKLTKHPEGSLKELLAISLPLMLSFLSGNLMMFLDRLILANYALEAMNAAAAAGMACMVVIYGGTAIASIAEVFVGRANGSREYGKAARAVWQMVWFSLMTTVIFVLLAQFGGPWMLSNFYYKEYGLPYFQWLLYFGPAFSLQAAFAAFFIGIGRTKIVLAAAVLGNAANVLLDLLLIFGLGFFPSLGAKGAALATGVSQLLQIAVLLVPFFNTRHRCKYRTCDIAFRPKLFFQCLRIGVPSSVGHMIEITGWAVLARMMISVGEAYITVIAIGQSFYSLIAFAMEGLQKAVTTVSANFIGAKKWKLIFKTWKSAFRQLVLLALIFSSFMIFYPDPIIKEFISKENLPESFHQVYLLLRTTCFFVWLYLILDGITWISAGILTAYGDTLFIMVMNAVSVWLFAIMPIYFFIVRQKNPPSYIWLFICIYGLLNALFFYIRFRFKLKQTKEREVL